MSFLDWFLLAWAAISVVATPLVGRLVANRLSDPPTEDYAPDCRTAHD